MGDALPFDFRAQGLDGVSHLRLRDLRGSLGDLQPHVSASQGVLHHVEADPQLAYDRREGAQTAVGGFDLLVSVEEGLTLAWEDSGPPEACVDGGLGRLVHAGQHSEREGCGVCAIVVCHFLGKGISGHR